LAGDRGWLARMRGNAHTESSLT